MTEEWERYRRGQAAKWLEHIHRLGARVETMRREIDAEREAASGLKAIQYDGMPKAATSTGDALLALADVLEVHARKIAQVRALINDKEQKRIFDDLEGCLLDIAACIREALGVTS